jgi:uncharacterized protein YbjQ (UPF0145 family)
LDDDVNDVARGLPPAAQQRVERQRLSGVSSSLFSAPAAAAAQSAGLAPVGEVFGCLVMTMGWAGTGCSWGNYGSQLGGTGFGSLTSMGGGFYAQPISPVTTSGNGGGYGGFTPYVRAFESGWNGAISRMLAEARALGAHGVVGVQIKRTRLENQTWEFTALGTAVRSTDPILAPSPAVAGEVWSTNLSAEDTASAILSGYLPHEIVLGLSVSTKHEDWQLAQQRNGWDNQEVEGMSELIRAARNEARTLIAAHATHAGGAELVVTHMDLYEFETQCGQDGRDFHAEASIIGTTLIPVPRFRGRPESSRVLTVIPLKDL